MSVLLNSHFRSAMRACQCLLLAAFIALQTMPAHSESKYYRGVIDGKHAFLMQIDTWSTSNICSGAYFYLSQKKPIRLSGVCKGASVTLDEQELFPTGKLRKSNRFVGAVSADTVSGAWQSADGSRNYLFEASVFQPSKTELLTAAIGVHRLYGISSAWGANAMSEIFQRKGQWQAGSSATSAGMRKGVEVHLSTKEKRALSALNVVVDKDLSIQLLADGKVLASFPYFDESIFDIKGVSPAQGDLDSRYRRYAGGKSFYDGTLHIATSDAFDVLNYMQFSDLPISGDHHILVDYRIEGFTFSVQAKECCAERQLLFVRY